jgi:hypothetical protein
MDLTLYVNTLRHELAVAAEAGGEDARALAERLTAPLESAVRLALLDALSAAADEITRDLAPGSVDLRLRGREPSFVVTLPLTDHSFDEPDPSAPGVPPPVSPDDEEGAMARINFRLAEHLKARIEEAAGLAGLSVNAWLVRAAAAALDSGDGGSRSDRPAPRGAPWGARRYTGWVR